MCTIPQVLIFMENSSVPPCTAQKDMECAHEEYRRILEAHIDPQATGCPVPCKQVRYKASLREDSSRYLGNLTSVSLYFKTSHVIAYEEYLLYDLNTIVAAVGGSLGLFLGFSCWHCMVLVVDRWTKFCPAKKVVQV